MVRSCQNFDFFPYSASLYLLKKKRWHSSMSKLCDFVVLFFSTIFVVLYTLVFIGMDELLSGMFPYFRHLVGLEITSNGEFFTFNPIRHTPLINYYIKSYLRDKIKQKRCQNLAIRNQAISLL